MEGIDIRRLSRGGVTIVIKNKVQDLKLLVHAYFILMCAGMMNISETTTS